MKLLSLILLFLTANLFAGTSGVQICNDSPSLYAFFEGAHSNLHNYSLWREDYHQTRQFYLKKALKRFKKVGFSVGSEIEKKLEEINLSYSFKRPVEALVDNRDIAFVNSGCRYETAASWNEFERSPRINRSIFEKLGPMAQAGLLFELSYHRYSMVVLGKRASVNIARQVTAKIFSDEIFVQDGPYQTGMTQKDLIEASLPYCNRHLRFIREGILILTKSIKLCEKYDGAAEAVKTFNQAMVFVQSSLDDCLRECFSNDHRRTCEIYRGTLKDSRCTDSK